jgi:predicted enzyme related to lactoylglutathione lyase
MLRGMCTARYHADDLAVAARWYSDVLGIEPYFQRPEYVEFRIGDYQHELGILGRQHQAEIGGHSAGSDAPSGMVVYWHVDDINGTVERLLSLGATLHEPARDFGMGFIGASVIDPFGNILGVMYNPHYREVVASQQEG